MFYQVSFRSGAKVPVQAEFVEYDSENFGGIHKPVIRFWIPDPAYPDSREKGETVAVFLAENIAGYVRDWAVRHSQPLPDHDSTSPSEPAPAPTPQIPPDQDRYLLIFMNHFTPEERYIVKHTEYPNPLPAGREKLTKFLSWCTPFVHEAWEVLEEQLAAKDSHPVGGEINWWTKPPYHLPFLHQQWLDGLDDEKWWVWKVRPKSA